ncbi:PREDICTED: acyl-CoA dehydrogenase family member 11-like isoform X1 [Gavialis gangeticus]|uniref:acyl-CoA dehydrogenase family member 11-like isoform X1 n=2 Tax=Gavialis gangeticus TaxID=94835 RepID=UPI00092EBD22|nr:PREDICTED: acyl-CoA dehydrogenase family member 11-like isoform X1 [Gavialis gangeticus]
MGPRGAALRLRIGFISHLPMWSPVTSGHPMILGCLLPWFQERCWALSCRGIKRIAGQREQTEAWDKHTSEELKVPFSRTATGTFFQEQPKIGNPYLEDAFLQGYLKAHLPSKVLEEVSLDLERFGARVVAEIDSLGRECELNPPALQQYNAWGQRVDHIITCPAWKRLKEIAAEEGLVAEAYERRYANWSRVYQILKLYLYTASSGFFSCPLAMTDGAAKVIETLGISGPLEKAFGHLTSRDPRKFWTSGQWMTERRGGSDVGCGTETVAKEQADGAYCLYGFKWFTSATDADMTLTLARIMDVHGEVEQGSRGLSLFFMEVRDKEGKLNGVEVQRLKEKLGTRQVPTAELLLDGAKAHRISAEGRGVASIANMLTITRIHNVNGSVSGMKRIISLGRDYASKRVAFGKFLKDHPLHMQTMARMEVQRRGAFLLLMEIARLLGLEETSMASERDQLLLRLLTPVAKLYTGKQAIAVISEGLECFGGQGYMEDTGLPVALRDAQVLTIWEGTTNILSLDVLRSLTKSQGQALVAFFSAVQGKVELASNIKDLESAVQRMQSAISKLEEFSQGVGSKGPSGMELAARDFAYTLARIYTGALLLEHAARPGASFTDIFTAQRWCTQDLCPVATEEATGSYDAEVASLDTALVYEGSPVLKGCNQN